MSPTMSGQITLEQVEAFLYREARLLDSRQLQEWEQLFTDDGRYLVPPVGVDSPEKADPTQMLFIIADDRLRIRQRVIRLLKPSAHAEYPPSRTRHMVTNIEILERPSPDRVRVTACFCVHRVRHQEVGSYMGQYHYELVQMGGALRIAEKRASLDLDVLMPQGALAFIL